MEHGFRAKAIKQTGFDIKTSYDQIIIVSYY